MSVWLIISYKNSSCLMLANPSVVALFQAFASEGERWRLPLQPSSLC